MKKLICLLLALLTVIACVPVLAEQESKALVLYFDYSENIDTTAWMWTPSAKPAWPVPAPGITVICW